MGFDAFGLPAENAAHQAPGHEWTYQNIAQAVKTMKRMGFSTAIMTTCSSTCDPRVPTKWGQWMFIGY